jgi:hypothetical protein
MEFGVTKINAERLPSSIRPPHTWSTKPCEGEPIGRGMLSRARSRVAATSQCERCLVDVDAREERQILVAPGLQRDATGWHVLPRRRGSTKETLASWSKSWSECETRSSIKKGTLVPPPAYSSMFETTSGNRISRHLESVSRKVRG